MDVKVTLDLSPEFCAAFDLFAARLRAFTEQLAAVTACAVSVPSPKIAAPAPASPPAAAVTPSPQAAPAGDSRVAFLDVSSQQTAPAAVSKEPPRAAFRAKTGNVWTPARDVLLRALYAANESRAEIFTRLNALPGDPIASMDAMSVHASEIGAKRPAPGAAAPGGKTSPEPLAVIPAGAAQISRWAADRGVEYRNSSDLPRVNAKRSKLGLPPFALAPSAGRLTGIRL